MHADICLSDRSIVVPKVVRELVRGGPPFTACLHSGESRQS